MGRTLFRVNKILIQTHCDAKFRANIYVALFGKRASPSSFTDLARITSTEENVQNENPAQF